VKSQFVNVGGLEEPRTQRKIVPFADLGKSDTRRPFVLEMESRVNGDLNKASPGQRKGRGQKEKQPLLGEALLRPGLLTL